MEYFLAHFWYAIFQLSGPNKTIELLFFQPEKCIEIFKERLFNMLNSMKRKNVFAFPVNKLNHLYEKPCFLKRYMVVLRLKSKQETLD